MTYCTMFKEDNVLKRNISTISELLLVMVHNLSTYIYFKPIALNHRNMC